MYHPGCLGAGREAAERRLLHLVKPMTKEQGQAPVFLVHSRGKCVQRLQKNGCLSPFFQEKGMQADNSMSFRPVLAEDLHNLLVAVLLRILQRGLLQPADIDACAAFEQKLDHFHMPSFDGQV